MIKRLLTTLLLLTLLSPIAWAEEVTATVDKAEIVPGETINLTITANERSAAPDLEPLKNLFDIAAMQENEQLLIENGKRTASRSWVISLVPKSKAQGIVIPPLQVGNYQTKPITIKLIDSPTKLTINGHDILKAEIAVDEKSVYIQQQFILTLRIYADSLHFRKFTNFFPPTIANADIKQLEDRRFERQINGRVYNITERRYAIAAQQSGELIIPSFAVSALVNQNDHFQNKTVLSNELTIKVKPKPANYPANMPWLPAKNISLTERWGKIPNNIIQGNTLTRTLTVTADGLASSQIDPIPEQAIAAIRSYPEKPKLKESWQNYLPLGTRSEQSVLIPIQAGDITIPAVKLAWWNTETNKLEYATIAERKIHVAANPEFTNSNSATNNNAAPPPTIIRKIESPHLWLWQLATAIFALTTVIGFALWFYARKQPAIIKPDTPIINPKTLLDDIKKACLDHDPQAARTALDNWVKQQPENLTEMVARYSPLAEAVETLNKALYSEENSETWQGETLWQAVQTLPPMVTPQATAAIIPPLYPK